MKILEAKRNRLEALISSADDEVGWSVSLFVRWPDAEWSRLRCWAQTARVWHDPSGAVCCVVVGRWRRMTAMRRTISHHAALLLAVSYCCCCCCCVPAWLPPQPQHIYPSCASRWSSPAHSSNLCTDQQTTGVIRYTVTDCLLASFEQLQLVLLRGCRSTQVATGFFWRHLVPCDAALFSHGALCRNNY